MNADGTWAESFTEREVDGLPDIVRRYLTSSIAPGTSLVSGVALAMRGRIRLGRWLGFEATEAVDPHRGFRWTARVAHGVVSGSDAYLDGRGSMAWRLFGVVPLVNASGPDVSHSAAGRAGAEAVLSPVSLLPRFGVSWRGDSPRSAIASWDLDGAPVDLRCWFDDDARITSLSLPRWGDPQHSGTWAWHQFAGEFTAHRRFGPITVPSAGRLGWTSDTGRDDFFDYELTALDQLQWSDSGATTELAARRFA